jgi:hypothetical protein
MKKIQFICSYRGHVPTVNYQYGGTYGQATEKYFQDYRSEILSTSKSLYARGGYFPSSYSNNPESVINHRKISRDRYLFNPKYQLNNTDFDRTQQINRFYQVRIELFYFCLLLFSVLLAR